MMLIFFYCIRLLFLKQLVNLLNYVKLNRDKDVICRENMSLGEDKQLFQRQVSATHEIDNTLYCKIEQGDRSTKWEQVIKLAELFHIELNDLLALWLADKVINIVGDERELTEEALEIAKTEIGKMK